ncbi:hypothetical protein DQ238_06970 [Geodermatophilus sp. TF02-6]|uniref:hypothetical protein n=1 Tax=Geodermatophilus sp. TF02-6 TaxID=2250575 RepID=UPI000DEAEBE8|nr:hypothetical protein [Geodermatophilus sp. TF02-6]RBY81749.1 hypothetical protein DQ238_06970 [Geodermatophilus sp. TF02-6]
MDASATHAPAPAVDARRLLPAMRVLLGAFALLTAIAVVTLFVLAGQTDRSFAWTIAPPLTAAFMGAGYAAGFVLVVLSLRDGVWARTRVPLLTILVFVVITLAATLLHLDRFHFAAEFADRPALARAAAWFWFAVYVVVPVGMLALLLPQERAPGVDPPARHPVPRVLRGLLAAESAVLTVVGAALFVAPATATTLWPWTLTPLTARVVAAWLVAFGVATALAAGTGDLERLRTAAIAYTVFGVLVAVSVLRFPGTVAWGDPAAWVFTAVVVAVIGTGAAGWRLAPAPGRSRHG